jgi:hypothetical protein
MLHQTACRFVVGSPSFWNAEFHLSIQIWINTSKNISEEGSSTMPNVSKEEKQTAED